MTEDLDFGDLMAKVCEHYDLQVPAWGKIRCPTPEHDDNSPSCSIDVHKGVWRCHGCGAGGGVYHLIAALEGHGDLGLARQRAESIAGGRLPRLSGAGRGGGAGRGLPEWARPQSEGRASHLPDWARR